MRVENSYMQFSLESILHHLSREDQSSMNSIAEERKPCYFNLEYRVGYCESYGSIVRKPVIGFIEKAEDYIGVCDICGVKIGDGKLEDIS